MDIQEKALGMAEHFARFLEEHLVEWQRPFVLARKLKGLDAGGPEQYWEAANSFCCLTEDSFIDFWAEFNHAWHKIKFPETGEDVLAWAFETALDDPLPIPDLLRPPDEVYDFLYSMAWHLACRTAPEPFFLPRKRIAEFLDCQAKTVTRIVQWLERNEVIQCVDEHYQWGGKKNRCKLYRLSPNAN
jgi:hypothetical protein